MIELRRMHWISLAAAFVIAACDDGAPATESGSYRLTSVEGEGLPFLMNADGPDSVGVLGGELHLESGNVFAQRLSYFATGATGRDTIDFHREGAYELDGRLLLLECFECGGWDTASYSGRTIELDSFRFERTGSESGGLNR